MSEQDDRKPLASIPMQFILYLDDHFSVWYFSIQLIVFVYKGYGLFYPPNSIILEVFLLFLFSFLQFGRISMGSSGNKTESPNTMIGFIIMCVPCAILFAYYLRLQTYVIVLEIVINTFGIVFLALEFLFSLSAFLTFKNYEKTQ